MAENLLLPVKKGRAAPVSKVSAKKRVKKFPTKLYENDGFLLSFL